MLETEEKSNVNPKTRVPTPNRGAPTRYFKLENRENSFVVDTPTETNELNRASRPEDNLRGVLLRVRGVDLVEH
jgi:hypothetical protein